ncbi:MAG: hypothetical protein GF313_02890 [Caldithrix sp.]|nr:hypothetical protein [Caldithrix sp.]
MNAFNRTVVQHKIKEFFLHSIARERLAHAYVFFGPQGTGKEAFALELAKYLNCESEGEIPCYNCPACQKIGKIQHPDIRFVFPGMSSLKSDEVQHLIKQKAQNPYADMEIEGNKNIAIEAIRELKNEAKYASFEARKRVFIISGAEYFSREAANSFLKLLEEPPGNLLIILVTEDKYQLMNTILSRCQPIYFPRFTDDQVKTIVEQYIQSEDDILPLIRIAQNNVKRVFKLLQTDYNQRREQAYKFLRAIASRDIVKIASVIDDLTQKRDKNYVLEVLELLMLWFRDVIHYDIITDKQQLINSDYEESIEGFTTHYRDSDFEQLVGWVEKSYFDIDHNAHPSLSLTNMAINMKNELIRDKIQKEV